MNYFLLKRAVDAFVFFLQGQSLDQTQTKVLLKLLRSWASDLNVEQLPLSSTKAVAARRSENRANHA